MKELLIDTPERQGFSCTLERFESECTLSKAELNTVRKLRIGECTEVQGMTIHRVDRTQYTRTTGS